MKTVVLVDEARAGADESFAFYLARSKGIAEAFANRFESRWEYDSGSTQRPLLQNQLDCRRQAP